MAGCGPVRVAWEEIEDQGRRKVMRCWAVCDGCGEGRWCDSVLDSARAAYPYLVERLEQAVLEELHSAG